MSVTLPSISSIKRAGFIWPCLYILLMPAPFLAQSGPSGEKEKQNPSQTNPSQTPPSGQQALDKEFYNLYLDSLPNERVESEKTLTNNMMRLLIKTIPREDSQSGPAFIKTLTPSALQIARVTEDSPFVRGIFQELPFLRVMPFMYVVRAGPYLIFCTFRVDPRVFITGEFQSKTVKQTIQESHP